MWVVGGNSKRGFLLYPSLIRYVFGSVQEAKTVSSPALPPHNPQNPIPSKTDSVALPRPAPVVVPVWCGQKVYEYRPSAPTAGLFFRMLTR